MTDQIKTAIPELLLALSKDVEQYFAAAADLIPKVVEKHSFFLSDIHFGDHYWAQLPDDLQLTANNLADRLIQPCTELAMLTRSSPLSGPEDLQDIKIATKSMRTALKLRLYSYKKADVIHDEGSILGLNPAEQTDHLALAPIDAKEKFFEHMVTIKEILKLAKATVSISPDSISNAITTPSKYRTGTAFIMMWMDSHHPELNDVADSVRSVFKSFGVRAVRADDIEHEGLITERVLNEIRTAEFLFADLTGVRPNVYYEIGFAHALGKRVILFRKSGTGVHFDLAGYNCPEYENLRDLREKLSKRLISLTNRNPSQE